MALIKTNARGQSSNLGRRNMIINGAMKVAQRGTSTTGITASSYNTVDRFKSTLGTAGTWTQSQSTDVPTGQGFASSLKMDCTTANASLSAGSFLFIEQGLEGQDLQHLKKGTASAESVTLSFWVKSSKTGTHICELMDNDNSRTISKSYTINVADTWEQKTITYAGDTTGAFGNDNGKSLRVNFHLVAGTNFSSGTLATSWESQTNANRAAGQVNLADSTSNDWYVTGVQLELGSTATDFEHRSYGEELQLCKRYYQYYYGNSAMHVGRTITGNRLDTAYHFPLEMRDDPTLEAYDIGQVYIAGQSAFNPSSPSVAAVHLSTNGLVIRRSCTETINANEVSSSQILYLKISSEL